MKKSILTLAAGAMMIAPALWAQASMGNNPNAQPNGQQGQVLGQQKPNPAQPPVIPANPVVQNAQQVQKSKVNNKKVQQSEIKTLADIQKAEDHDLNAISGDHTLNPAVRSQAIAKIRAKYDAMRKDVRFAANKTQKLDRRNEKNAKAKELKAEKASQTPLGQ